MIWQCDFKLFWNSKSHRRHFDCSAQRNLPVPYEEDTPAQRNRGHYPLPVEKCDLMLLADCKLGNQKLQCVARNFDASANTSSIIKIDSIGAPPCAFEVHSMAHRLQRCTGFLENYRRLESAVCHDCKSLFCRCHANYRIHCGCCTLATLNFIPKLIILFSIRKC